MEQKRKELVKQFIAKLKCDIQEVRGWYNRKDFCIYDEQTCRLNLIKLDVVEKIFCNKEFYGGMNSYDNYIISNRLLTLLCMRGLSTAYDLMDSVYLSTPFANQKEFEFNLLTPLEYGLLSRQLEENNNEQPNTRN